MRKLISLGVDNPVLVNILLVMIIIVGLFSFIQLPRELISEVKFNWVMIITPWPGASSEEVEQLLTIPIEEEIQDVSDIDEIVSQSDENYSFMMVKFRTMSDELFLVRSLELKAEIDKIVNLPDNTRKDMEIKSLDTTEMIPVITLNLSGPLDELEMRSQATDIRRRLLQINGVAKAELFGTNERQVWVELDPELLESYGIVPEMVSNALALANRNIPAGKVKAGREELLLRTIGRFEDADRIKKVIIRSQPGGNSLQVEDIATVTDGFEEMQTESHFNGQKSVSITIAKRSQASTTAIIDQIRDLVAELRPNLPAGVELALSGDTSVQIKETMRILGNNAMLGMILIMIFLYLAIGARNAFFVALGIPVTFLTTFIFMYYSGNSINGNSLFGLILVIGVVVDDAIIIIENCYRHYQMGKTLKESAIDGTTEVAKPVISATLTTVAAFLPLMLMPGIMGKFMKLIPIVVCLVLAASMVEAFIFLPSHFAEWSSKKTKAEKVRPWVARMQAWYGRTIIRLMNWRRTVVISLFVMLVGAVMVIPLVGFELAGGEEVNIFQIFVETPSGTNLEETNKIIQKVEKIAGKLPKDDVLSIQGTAGLMRTETDWLFGNNIGEVLVELVPLKEGRRTLDQIIGDLRGEISAIPGIDKLRFVKPSGGPPTGRPIEIRVLGRDFDQLLTITKELKEYLGQTEGIVDIQDSWISTKKEIRVIVDEPAAAYYGLDLAGIASFIRTAFEGQVSTRYRDGNDEVEVLVRYPRDYEKDMNNINQLKIPGYDKLGQIVWVPFNAVAKLEQRKSWPRIDRLDQERYIGIKAGIDAAYKNQLVAINQDLINFWNNALQKKYPGYRITMGGEFKEFEESFKSLQQLFLIGVFLIFVILGGQFKSFIQPFIILFTIPFAFIGAMIGLLVSGSPFSIVTMYGIVALGGVAVNDAIVLIDFVNNSRKNGMGKNESLIESGKLRLRPIFLTTITTVGGLLPIALGLGGRSQSWAPLANVIVFGMIASTLMTLFVIPIIYKIIIDDIPDWRRSRKERRRLKKGLSPTEISG